MMGRAQDSTWDVILMGFPNALSPKQLEVMSVGYVIHQTHKPLFQRNEDGQYTSAVLEKWSQSRDGLEIELCPSTSVFVGKDQLFTTARLENFLATRMGELGARAKFSSIGSCLMVRFENPNHEFIETFAHFENAPSWSNSSPFEDGLGDFYVAESATDHRMVLLRKYPTQNGFKRIVVHAYKNKEQAENLVKAGGIEDINRISPDLVPDSLKKNYSDYGVVLLHTGVLLINARDARIRKAIYNCLDIEKFRRAFSPTQSYFKSVKTILPIGAPGAKEGLAAQDCKPTKNARARFWNWKDNNRDQLRAYLKEFSKVSGVEVDYSDIPLSTLMDVVGRKIRDYDMLVVGLSATEFHYRDFYQYLVDPKSTMISAVALDYSRELKDIDSKPNDQDVLAKVDKIDRAIADQAIALPLFQQTRHFYFPRSLKGLKFGGNSLEHPVVAELSQ